MDAEIWKERYINQLVLRGLGREFATETYEAGADDHDTEFEPEDAADEELSYWSE